MPKSAIMLTATRTTATEKVRLGEGAQVEERPIAQRAAGATTKTTSAAAPMVSGIHGATGAWPAADSPMLLRP